VAGVCRTVGVVVKGHHGYEPVIAHDLFGTGDRLDYVCGGAQPLAVDFVSDFPQLDAVSEPVHEIVESCDVRVLRQLQEFRGIKIENGKFAVSQANGRTRW